MADSHRVGMFLRVAFVIFMRHFTNYLKSFLKNFSFKSPEGIKIQMRLQAISYLYVMMNSKPDKIVKSSMM